MSDKTDSKSSGQESQFHILPAPDKPKEPAQTGAGLNFKPELAALNTPGPVIPDRQALINAGPPASNEELAVRTQELNQ
ncbi:hypothetical protein BJ322DRAFT_558528 [Thelephora terrestris]|uniref:Uncharacterized protein n=1 Tax=Thelephora terrestris TaxID=56493 RepID=A0A9P6HLF9_9AGAM|nr:hypothetical protein BJ322DRAFT_558528 [Thelephora terrestris]